MPSLSYCQHHADQTKASETGSFKDEACCNPHCPPPSCALHPPCILPSLLSLYSVHVHLLQL